MYVFSVAIPVDAPLKVYELVRGVFTKLRIILDAREIEGVVFDEKPWEESDVEEHQVQG